MFSPVLVKCDASVFNMCAMQPYLFQQKGKGLFIRSSKLFDSTLLLKPTTNLWAVVDSPLDSLSPLEEEGKWKRKQECMVLWIFKAGTHMGASSILYFTEGENAAKGGRRAMSTAW